MALIPKVICFLAIICALPAQAQDTLVIPPMPPVQVSIVEPLSSIKITPLPALSLSTLGTHSYLPKTLWTASDPAELVGLISKTVKQNLSPASAQVVREMLLTDTSGEKWEKDTLSSHQFLITRLQGLVELGYFQDALDLIALIPEGQISNDILNIKTIALFLNGDMAQGCPLLDNPAQEKLAEKMRLTCFLVSGDKAKAALGFAVFNESGMKDSVLTALGNTLFQEAKLALPKNPTYAPEHAYLLAALGDKMPDMSHAPRWLKKTLSLNPAVPISTRIQLAEQLGDDPDQLKKLYLDVFPKTPEKTGALKRAALYRKAIETKDTKTRVNALNTFYDLARADGVFIQTAPVTAELLYQLTPSNDTLAIAFNAVQVLALEDNLSLAHPWHEALLKNPSATYMHQAMLLSVLMNKMGAGMPKSIDEILSWCQTDKSPYCVRFIQTLPGYFPIKNPEKFITDARQEQSAYSPVTPLSLASMVEEKRTGETILWITLLLARSNDYEKNILNILDTIRPLSLSKSILIEQLIYP